ncbi:MAG: 50S ribosomal protein L17 [candidate division WOR-3 bacterium]
MRHHKKIKKFHRKRGQRKAFIKVLAQNLIRDQKIKTTETRAKALRSFVERLITLGKKQTLSARRLVIARLGNKKLANKLVDEIAPKYLNRPGGYLKITKTSHTRKRDSAPMVVLEFVK